MLLTWPWVLSVYGGLVDMDDNGNCIGYKQSAGSRLSEGSKAKGICYLDGVSINSKLMVITSLTYFAIQIPALKVDDQRTSDQAGDEFIPEVLRESAYEKTFCLA